MTHFRVTYDTYTEESVEQGNSAESGFYSRGGWKHDDPSDWTLHEVVAQFGRNSLENGGRSFYTVDHNINYRTGEETSYGVHPPRGITRASYARIQRILDYRKGARS